MNQPCDKSAAFLIIVLLTLGTTTVALATQLQAIRYNEVSADHLKIHLQFDRAVANPLVFNADNPPRLIIDLSNTNSTLTYQSIPVISHLVESANLMQTGNNIRLVFKLLKSARYQVNTAGTQIDVDIESESPQPVSQSGFLKVAAPTQSTQNTPTGNATEKRYSGEPLSLNFQNIAIRSVLQLLADFTGLNMVVSDTVSGNITLRLKNVPWDQAMDIILKTKGLSMRRDNNVILIAPTEELAIREKLERESQIHIDQLAPLQSQLIQINYAKASDLSVLLKSPDNRLLSERGNVTVDERTNALLVQDTATKLIEIQGLIQRLDIPVRQVLIESRIVIANDDFAKDLGVRLGMDYYDSGNSNVGFGGGLAGDISWSPSVGQTTLENPSGSGNQALLVNLPQTLAAGRGGAINFVLGKVGQHLLRLELNAMQQEGKGKIISSPRIITSDQNKALIKQGVEIPYQEATSGGATSVSFKEAVLQLEVTPHITPDHRVIMDLKVNKDNPDFTRAVLGVPPVDTRELKTSVLVDNNETIVLGGVFERTQAHSVARVPVFSELPVVGALFSQSQTQEENSELLIFVTPKILQTATAKPVIDLQDSQLLPLKPPQQHYEQ